MAKLIYENDTGDQITFNIETDLIRDSVAIGVDALSEIFKVFQTEVSLAVNMEIDNGTT